MIPVDDPPDADVVDGSIVPERRPQPSFASTLAGRAAVLLGLSTVAVTQPLLELFGRNPEFFVASRYTPSQIVAFALVIALGPAVVATAFVALASAIHPKGGAVIFAVAAGIFGAALGLVLLRSAEVEGAAVVAAVAVAAGVAISLATTRTRGGRLLASYLAVAAVVFLGLFLVASPAAALVWSDGPADRGTVDVPPPAGPVVWIILDELPAATIMRADGTVNAERYPGFAELASVSDWYRNASSSYNLTHRAVPAQLEGVLARPGDLPRYQDHPRSVFTLLGDQVPVHRYESVTDLCPPTMCDPPPRQPLMQALEDAAILYGHRALPPSWRDGLPRIDESWGSFGQEDDTGSAAPATSGQALVTRAYEKWRELGAAEKSPLGQAGILREQIEAITAEPALHFVHVALPHRPWTLSPSGVSSSFSPPPTTDRSQGFAARVEFQLHSMQVGAADVLIGELLDHLRSLESWEETLLVVTSDHGTNLTLPDIGRMHPTEANSEEIYRVPLFIKAPGQERGEVHDEPASTLDILPTVVDLLEGDVDWNFDGHSLVDGSAASVESRVSSDVATVLDIAARRAEQFPHGDDWLGLAAVGPNGDLVGSHVADHDIGSASAFRVRLEQTELFADLPTDEGTAPFVLPGVVAGPSAPSSDLVVAINGRIAGVLGGYQPVDGGFTFTGYVADLYRRGSNEVVVYEVERTDGVVTLHPLSTG